MPGPGVSLPVDTVAVRYVQVPWAEHIWTCGPGMITWTLRLLRKDKPTSVDAVRWTGTDWQVVADDWVYGRFVFQDDGYDDDDPLVRYGYDRFHGDEEREIHEYERHSSL